MKIDPDTIDSGSIEIRDGLKYVKGSLTPIAVKFTRLLKMEIEKWS